MGQIKVVESKSQKKQFVFSELKIGEVFRVHWGTLYLKIDQDTVFNLTYMNWSATKINPTLDVYPVNATLTIEE